MKSEVGIELTVSISFPSSFQASIPPDKKPKVLSKPTLERRVTASSSLPSGTTSKIAFFTSTINSPTQGAKPPSSPIKMLLGRCPVAKSAIDLTSRITAWVSFAIFSNSLTVSGFEPFFNTTSILSYPSLLSFTFIGK